MGVLYFNVLTILENGSEEKRVFDIAFGFGFGGEYSKGR